jgi:fatty-acyl-CoA synthase
VTFPKPGEALRWKTVDRNSLAQGFISELPDGDARGTALIGCGRPLPGHDVRIVDAQGRAVQAGEVGHVIVRGPSLMQGYFEDPRATQSVMRDGWLWSGDLGFREADGLLFIAGRAKDIIIVRGKNHYAEDVERTMEKVEGVRPSGSVAFALYDEEKASDLTVGVCETRVSDEHEREALAVAIADAVSAECGLTLDEVVLVPPGTLPKTSSGKRQRSLCRERYLNDELLQAKPNRLRLALVFARSGRGFLSLLQKRIARRLRAPE